MEPNWGIEQEIMHFKKIWESRRPGFSVDHTKEAWNERAHEWIKELKEKPRQESSRQRVEATVDYLHARGLLNQEQDVIDIGCGPGRFVAAFAKTARHVVGTDLSGQMLEYGMQYASELGIANTSYVEADFQTADIDDLGWRGRFDLVFSSITPAISGSSGLQKLMDISRGWCFNSCFVHFEDELEKELIESLSGKKRRIVWNGHWHWFYSLFNLLLLEGYYPETSYYKETRHETVAADEETAGLYAKRLEKACGKEQWISDAAILEYLKKQADKDGFLVRSNTCWYGWILWDVRHKTEREFAWKTE